MTLFLKFILKFQDQVQFSDAKKHFCMQKDNLFLALINFKSLISLEIEETLLKIL